MAFSRGSSTPCRHQVRAPAGSTYMAEPFYRNCRISSLAAAATAAIFVSLSSVPAPPSSASLFPRERRKTAGDSAKGLPAKPRTIAAMLRFQLPSPPPRPLRVYSRLLADASAAFAAGSPKALAGRCVEEERRNGNRLAFPDNCFPTEGEENRGGCHSGEDGA